MKALILLLLLATPVMAADYYIDPLNGNDANAGTQVSPKRTVNAASLKAVLQPGDTVYLLDTAIYSGTQGMYIDGTYPNGTQASPITIKAADGAAPVFKGCGVYQIYFGLLRDWYNVDGLTFLPPDNPADCAQPVTVDVLIQGAHNTVKNCSASSVSSVGVKISNADYNTVEDSTFTNIGSAGTGVGVGEAVTILGGRYNTVQRNTVNGAGHTAIGVYDYLNLTRISMYNQILSNTIDQGTGTGRNGGGGGIYIQVQSTSNTVEGNTIRNIGQMAGITQPKAGIDITASSNIIRNNQIESYGVPANELHKGIYLNSTTQFSNLHADGNLFEGNFIGAGYGVPLYIREGTGSRASGATVANNTFRSNTITAQVNALTSGDYIGTYNPTGKYLVYMGSYTDGAWPVFANGNTFAATTFIHDGTGLVGYYYGSGGFSKSIAAAYTDYPAVFSASLPTHRSLIGRLSGRIR